MSATFRLTAQDPLSAARTGLLMTPHGAVETPAFMPVASQGTVKGLTHAQVESLGAEIVLVNSYHLFLRPGVETVEALGGLHGFISWPRPILTDSGGFQIYSLSPLVRVSDEGVRFASHLDGAKIFLRPEDVIDLEVRLGADVLMCLDHFPPYPYSDETLRESVRLTGLWARRSKARWAEHETRQQLWGICQGGVHADLRQRSIEGLLEEDFSGYAYGGLGIGEPKTKLFEMLELGRGLLPADRPRYLMGMGYIEDVVEAYVKLVASEHWGTVFNLCSGEPRTVREVIERLLSHAPRELRLEIDPALVRPDDVPVVYGSSRKAHDAFGFEPRIPLEQAIAAAWAASARM